MRRREGICRSLAMVLIATIFVVEGCTAPYPDAVLNSDGQSIRLSDIGQILSQTDLSEDQKKDALRALGITDEELLNVLVTQAQP